MAGKDSDGPRGFNSLFAKNVPHILERIFFSIDYESYKACFEVSKDWENLLTSDEYKRKARSLFAEDILKDKELWMAAREGPSGRGNLSNIERIFSTGLVNVNGQHGKNNTTALCMAVDLGHKDIARLLIERGADPNIGTTNAWGTTALLHTVLMGQETLANLLLDAGADPNKANDDKHTPLRYASASGRTDLVKRLLAMGADPNKTEPHRRDKPWKFPGSTALMCAVFNGHKDVVRLLLEKGANPNVREGSTQGYTAMTPLHYAALFGHKETAQMLVEAGAKVDRRDKDGRTPLNCAAEKGHHDIAQLLFDRGGGVGLTKKACKQYRKDLMNNS